jgi:pimeloyl-ACP methyl ester carboxylesterase
MPTINKTDEQLIDANGIQLTYDAFGNPSDPPILLVMGLGMQMTAWDELFCEHLAARGFWVIRFDNRDIGLSTKIETAGRPSSWKMMSAGLFHRPMSAPYRLKDMAADTAGLMDALDIRAAHIVGVSMGGMIAQEMAIRHPERLLTMTSVMSTTGDSRLPKASLNMRLRLLKRSPNEQHAYENHIVHLFKLLNGTHFPFDELKYRMQAATNFKRSYYPVGIARQLAAVIASGSRKEKLGTVDTPALIIHGDADPLIPVAHGHATAYAIPGSKLHIINGMAHTLPQGAWPEIIDAIVKHAANGSSGSGNTINN